MEDKKADIKKVLEGAGDPTGIFSDLSGKLKEAKSLFEKKDFDAAIAQSRDSLDLIQTCRKKFLSISMGYSVTGSTELISQISKTGVSTKEAEGMVKEVTEHVLGEDFEKAHEGIGKLLEIIKTLKEKQVAASKKLIDNLKKLIEDVKGIEADTSEADSILAKAESAFNAKNYVETAELVEKATESAEKKREERIQTVKEALSKTRSLIDESKSIGVDISKPNKLFKEAEEAFQNKDYTKCFELNTETEKVVSELEEAQIQKVMEVQKRKQTREQDGPAKEAGEKAPEEEETEEEAATDTESESEDEGIISRRFEIEDAAAEEEDEEEDDEAGMPEMKVISGDTGTEGTDAEQPASQGKQAVMCSSCGSIMRYIEQYSRYWCDQCQKYAE